MKYIICHVTIIQMRSDTVLPFEILAFSLPNVASMLTLWSRHDVIIGDAYQLTSRQLDSSLSN